MLDKLKKVMHRPTHLRKIYLSFVYQYRKLTITLAAFMHGLQLEIGQHRTTEQPLRVQGEGRLRIKNKGVFCYSMFRGRFLLILLQSRSKTSSITIHDDVDIVNDCEFIAAKNITIGTMCQVGPRTRLLNGNFYEEHFARHCQSDSPAPVVVAKNAKNRIKFLIFKSFHIANNSIIKALPVANKDLITSTVAASNFTKDNGTGYA